MKKTILFLLALCIAAFVACGKKKDSNAEGSSGETEKTAMRSADVSGQLGSPMPPSEDAKKVSSEKEERNLKDTFDKTDDQLGKVFAPISASTERLLEYNIQLSYTCTDLVKTRKELLDYIAKYGYLESSSAINSKTPYMSVRMHVRSAKLYEALLDLDKLGVLISEDISTIDHTEGMVWQKRKTTREKIRLSRRNNANQQIGAASKNWEVIEESIERSEDELDLAEQETWKIKDRVSWATIAVNFGTPAPPDAIEVPEYRNAFVGILNAFLQLSYYLLWILPFAIIASVLVYYGGILFQNLRKKFRK
ncbi:DUF4349 domain-containing protein [Leptospira adleri]|uniref:DUF4349 domain-containing protein n=1 Tax=Leptospira adleri TaxID=2023186 RepID=A0A2M9YPN3_9LEPT|nr:DUF4349 domain-containing protein [Leptospira adleri]PJZ53504.1 hypothetical protein CH380_10000 [Leptospira adleri]PJZ62243.1 hypothetical protein CH376_09230 [Leptospira adleri]